MTGSSSYRPSFFKDEPSISIFQQWLDEHQIRTHPSLSLAPMANSTGYRIVSKEAIQLGSVLCTVPKSMIFSHETCSLDTSHLAEPENAADMLLRLAGCLLHELRLGKESKWYGWLQVLPRDTVVVPLLWGVGEISGQDGERALRWVEGCGLGTEIKRQEESDGLSLEILHQYYSNLALPLTSDYPSPPTLLDFLYVFSLISSRGFMLDAYHQIGIPPFCDMLNHSSTSAHTSLLCDADVCPICGSLPACAHDEPDSDRLKGLTQGYLEKIKEEGASVDMRAERDIAAGIEVFSCYEEGLTPAKSLVGYGFLPSDGKGVKVEWGAREILDDANGPVFLEIVRNGRVGREVFRGNQEESGQEWLLSPWSEGQALFELHGNGQILINISIAIYIRTAIQQGKEFEDLEDLEQAIIRDTRVLQGDCDSPGIDMPLQVLHAVIRAISDLLHDRLNGMYKPEYGPEEIERMILALPASSTLQRQAMQYTMEERSLLYRTKQRWQQQLEIIDG